MRMLHGAETYADSRLAIASITLLTVIRFRDIVHAITTYRYVTAVLKDAAGNPQLRIYFTRRVERVSSMKPGQARGSQSDCFHWTNAARTGDGMARTIVTSKEIAARAGAGAVRDLAPGGTPGGAAGGTQPDRYQDRLIKYIPADVIAVYLAIAGILKTANGHVPLQTIQWVVFLILVPGTWLYLWRVAQVTKWQQIAISVVAFVVWVFSLGGPFAQFAWYDPVYGAVLLPLYTFLVPIFEPAT